MKYTVKQLPEIQSDDLRELFETLQLHIEQVKEENLEIFEIVRSDGKDLNLQDRLLLLALMKASLTDMFQEHLKQDKKIN